MFVAKSTGPQNLRVRLPEGIRDRWVGFCDRKKIKQQDAALALVEFVLQLEDELATLVLGQVDQPTKEKWSRLILADMAKPKFPHKVTPEPKKRPRDGDAATG